MLTQFGLSRDETSLFILLSQANKGGTNWLKGSDISRLSKKGRVRTYQILQRLLELGLAKVDFSRPKKYSSVSPQVALRRLLSAQESKLTELSHLESPAIESLLALEPIHVASKETDDERSSKSGSVISILQGLANVQIALREIVDNADHLLAVASEESFDHLFTMVGFLANRPKSMRFVLSGSSPSSIRDYSSQIKEYKIDARSYRGGFPTFLITKSQVVFLYYTVQEKRARPLSPVTVTSGISQIAVISSESYVQRMSELFELVWSSSEEIRQLKKTIR